MKFVELKKYLTGNIDKCYLLEGEDRFVVSNALSLIEKKVNLSMPDVNRIVLEGENATIEAISFNTMSFPFGDEKKLVIVKELNSKENSKKLTELIKALPDFVVLVVVSFMQSALTKAIKEVCTFVDCSKLDEKTIKAWIGGQLKKANLNIEEKAMEKLVLYTNSNMARVETETSKLISMGEELITASLVDKYVVRDKEYQIYELIDYLSKRDSVNAYDLIDTMLLTEKNPVGLIQYLYSAFRKLLIISLSKESDEDLAKLFKVKPYSVKMSRVQAGKFTPKELKIITTGLSDLEFDIKKGKANQENAVHIMIAKILSI